MQTMELIQEIRRLPLSQQFLVVEETLKAIKKRKLNANWLWQQTNYIRII